MFCREKNGKWRIEMNAKEGIVHLGMDSEGTGREKENLLQTATIAHDLKYERL